MQFDQYKIILHFPPSLPLLLSPTHSLGADGVHSHVFQQIKDVVVVYLDVRDKDGILAVLVYTLLQLAGLRDTQYLTVVRFSSGGSHDQ